MVFMLLASFLLTLKGFLSGTFSHHKLSTFQQHAVTETIQLLYCYITKA